MQTTDNSRDTNVNVFYLLCFTVIIANCSFSGAQESLQQTALEQELAGEMVSIPAGTFRMGDLWETNGVEQSPHHETQWRNAGLTPAVWRDSVEKPFHLHPVRVANYLLTSLKLPTYRPIRVTVPAFRLGKYEVTFAQWDACVADGGCNGYSPHDGPYMYDEVGRVVGVEDSWGRGNRPVINVSWDDAQSFIRWLNGKTGGNYRLPSEAEWEYAARAGSTTEYSWGDDIGSNRANCHNIYCGDSWDYTAPVGSFPANPWGLHDMHGNIWEWVQDCWHNSYEGAPADGSAWTSGDCSRRVIRGGAWDHDAGDLRSANRSRYVRTDRDGNIGFRLAQDE